MTDQEIIDWMERHLFDSYWDGTLGRRPTWRMAGPYRHVLAIMRGEDLRAAITRAAREYP